MKKIQVVAVLSGGLDSAMALCMSQNRGDEVVLALTFDYGQRSAPSEFRQASLIATHYGIPHRQISLPWFREFKNGGKLLDSSGLPAPTLSQLDDISSAEVSAKAVWVPNRNGVFLEIAAGIAEDIGAQGILVGFNAEEAETFPDNSTAYIESLNHALSYSTATGVTIISPTAIHRKNEIVRLGRELQFPFPLLWSCYEDQGRMCGRCESCMRLKRALHQNELLNEDWFEYPALH